MSLDIRDQRVHDLAWEASERSGLSLTRVVEKALEQYLQGLDSPATAEARRLRVAAILGDIDARMTPEGRALLTTDDLHDDSGLPT